MEVRFHPLMQKVVNTSLELQQSRDELRAEVGPVAFEHMSAVIETEPSAARRAQIYQAAAEFHKAVMQ